VRVGPSGAIDKRLNWILRKRRPHDVSVFDRETAAGLPPPPYMRDNGNFNGWWTATEQRRTLLEAVSSDVKPN